MRIRTLLASVTMGAAVLASGIIAPAQAASPDAAATKEVRAASNDQAPARAAAWTEAIKSGAPVRSCPSSTCDPLWRTAYAGQPLEWYNVEINDAGNLWYELNYPRWGWIYCGNVTAPC
ncbi:hypothetical protein [Streptomyces subrutilus]|uniref:SH3 domain-containing protein n=1 Tax=Streptomyces subrutilus TaxID=36818 RepID=A0A1E5PZZ4_9ACTN|nr:hypothetical protein [Streptomyces subrutilus]OEJ35218.1 hypothetical protein BGK67_31415 [Streptomyces subrutilus]